MHNNIMAAGSRDRPPMLAIGRYPQWQSRFLRYIDTRPSGDALRKCILEGPYQPNTVTIQAVYATKSSLVEAIHLLLTGIGDEIYSTVDVCKTAHEMWIAIERIQQESYYFRFYKMMNEMIRNNLIVATMQVNVQFLQQLQTEWSRFVTIVKQQHDLDRVSYHKLFDVLKQYQKEVNEIRTKRIAKNANPLALVAAAQQYLDPYYQAPKSYKSYAPTSKQSSSTKSNATTKFKGKKIAKTIIPPSELTSKEDSDLEQAERDKDMQKKIGTHCKRTVIVVGARETVGSQVVQQTGIQCFNYKEFGHFAKEYKKPKRVKDSTYHKEKMLLCKQAEKGVPLQAEQDHWLEDTNEEIDGKELEAHYSYKAKIQEVPTTDSGNDIEPLEQVHNDAEYNVFANVRHQYEQLESTSNTCLVKKDDSNVNPNLPDMCDNDIQIDQNAEDEQCKSILAKTCKTLGSLIVFGIVV
nr:hypothetical protein [Tanacetum cinerariifolium]